MHSVVLEGHAYQRPHGFGGVSMPPGRRVEGPADLASGKSLVGCPYDDIADDAARVFDHQGQGSIWLVDAGALDASVDLFGRDLARPRLPRDVAGDDGVRVVLHRGADVVDAIRPKQQSLRTDRQGEVSHGRRLG